MIISTTKRLLLREATFEDAEFISQLLEPLGFSYYDNFTFSNATEKLSLFSVYLPLTKDVSE